MDSSYVLSRVMDPVIAAALRSHKQRQRGAGLAYFSSPIAYQRGRGLGSLVRSLFRPVKTLFKKPIVRKGLSKLGQAATHALLEAGQQALEHEDVNFKTALKDSSKKHAKTLLQDVKKTMTGQGKRRRTTAVSRKRTPVKKRRVTPLDIFG